jgi:predicted extracellular nuclease
MKKSAYLFLTALALAPSSAFTQTGTNIVISQVYGGGGNSGAPYTHDFVELFNPTGSGISIVGWSIQYASATGSTWNATPLAAFIPPGEYFLVQQSPGGANGTPLPTPDATGTLIMSATAGKIALVNDANPLSGLCPTGGNIIDLVGYGATAQCYEGTGWAPAPSNTSAIFRVDSGCTDSNDNTADFYAAAPAPRNSASPVHLCSPSAVFSNAISESDNHYIFPNPAVEKCTIHEVQCTICNVEVYGALGNLIIGQNLSANNQRQITFDVSGLSGGIYFVRIKNERKISAEKFIIAR